MEGLAAELTANEVIDADTVGAAVAAAYDTGPVTSTLIRRGFNDTYAVTTPAGDRFAARVYLAGKYYLRDDSDVHFELDLLAHLAGAGVPVSAPVERADGGRLGHLVDGDGRLRPLALFTWAPGEPAENDPTSHRARALGEALGLVHRHADRFSSPHSRYRLDAAYLLDQPERLLAERFEQADDDRFEPYRPLFAAMREFVVAQPVEGPEFGFVHGDPHGRNAHADATDQVTLFDFDHGGFGWRAYDVATASWGFTDDLRAEFLAGYRCHFPLSDSVEAGLPRWHPVRMVWDIGDMLAMAPVQNRTFNPPLDKDIEFLEQVRTMWDAAAG